MGKGLENVSQERKGIREAINSWDLGFSSILQREGNPEAVIQDVHTDY